MNCGLMNQFGGTMIQQADIIVDLQYGDTGKGKICNAAITGGEYDLILRYNGGGNAGHTFYYKNTKIVTHQVPMGVVYGITSIIGPGCVVDLIKLQEELKYIEDLGRPTPGKYLCIDKRAHIVTQDHKNEDADDIHIGTTKQGIGPAYRDKYDRKGITIEEYCIAFPDDPFIQSIRIIDIYKVLFDPDIQWHILCEGAQGFYLDPMWGQYPYVTSSHCTVAAAIQNGIPYNKVGNVFGIAKAYETYVGNNPHWESLDASSGDPVIRQQTELFGIIQQIGNEYGATTGRLRKVRFLNLDELIPAININGVTHVAINKIDILEKVGLLPVVREFTISPFTFTYKNEQQSYNTAFEYMDVVQSIIEANCSTVKSIRFLTGEK